MSLPLQCQGSGAEHQSGENPPGHAAQLLTQCALAPLSGLAKAAKLEQGYISDGPVNRRPLFMLAHPSTAVVLNCGFVGVK